MSSDTKYLVTVCAVIAVVFLGGLGIMFAVNTYQCNQISGMSGKPTTYRWLTENSKCTATTKDPTTPK